MSISRQVRRAQARQAAKGKGGPLRRNYDEMKITGLDPGKVKMEGEILVSCALIDAQGVTHRGFKSHSDLRRSLGRADPYTSDPADTYGFWTSEGRFVTRLQAVEVGVASGQLSASWKRAGRELLSSDIW